MSTGRQRACIISLHVYNVVLNIGETEIEGGAPVYVVDVAIGGIWPSEESPMIEKRTARIFILR